MKYIHWFVSFIFILGFVACSEERLRDGKGELQEGLNLSLNVPETTVVFPMTKAGQEDTRIVSDLNILIYDSNKKDELPVKNYYYTNVEDMKGLSAGNTSENPVTFNFPLSNGSYSIRVVANAGSDMSGMTCENVDAKSFDYKEDGSIYKVMYGADDVTVANGRGQASVSLERIYAMITVQVRKSLAANIDIVPLTVELKHVPATGCLTGINKIGDNCLLKEAGGTLNSDLFADHSAAQPLYMYENKQPEGKCSTKNEAGQNLSTTTSPALGYDKTPASFSKPISMAEVIATDKVSSYIEVTANYFRDNENQGTIKYRFFLGKNATTNFEVLRNHHYRVTLMLGGQGGKDEVSWRVETDMMYEINTSDIYIGYLADSKGSVVVTTKDGSSIQSLSVTKSEDNGITLSGPVRSGDKWIFTATASQTNLMQDAYNTGSFKITAHFKDRKTNSKTVKVVQVSRLVDPIAIYKSAANTKPVEVKVKEYARGDLDYHILKSDGAWSLEIEKGGWFTISCEGKTVQGEGDVIQNPESGEVRFTYKPLNANPDGDYDGNGKFAESDKARYGIILVKYHNNNCEHRIYLRQGYHPTIMPGSNVAWSMFNCIGDRGDRRVGAYPTQTGYFYQPGCNTRFHPYSPGFKVDYGNDYLNAKHSTDTWIENISTPCPSGYKLPDKTDYSNIANSNSMIQGFVHDEDPVAGWSRNRDGKISLDDRDEGVHCNPAKGTLIVDRKTGKSLFFSFGKGILTSHDQSYTGKPSLPTDINLDEIGVGLRRESNGQLVYQLGEGGSTDRYGAIYYTGSQSKWASTSLAAIDFWYDMSSPEKNGNVIYDPSGQKDAGFIRCVRDGDSGGGDSGGGDSGTVTFIPGGKFRYGHYENGSWIESKIMNQDITVYYGPSYARSAKFHVTAEGYADNYVTLPSNEEVILEYYYHSLFISVNELMDKTDKQLKPKS